MKPSQLFMTTTVVAYLLVANYFGFAAPVTLYFCYALVALILLVYGEQLLHRLVFRPLTLLVNLFSKTNP
jgi:hypothetical protein